MGAFGEVLQRHFGGTIHDVSTWSNKQENIINISQETKVMNVKHTTQNGETIFISEMEDSHLINTINLYIRKIEEAKAELVSDRQIDKMKKALYGVKKVNDKELGEFIKNSTVALAPYIMEAMLRGIDFSEKLQNLYDRKGKEGISNQITYLPQSVTAYSVEDEIIEQLLTNK